MKYILFPRQAYLQDFAHATDQNLSLNSLLNEIEIFIDIYVLQ